MILKVWEQAQHGEKDIGETNDHHDCQKNFL